MPGTVIERIGIWRKPYALAGRAMFTPEDWLALRNQLGLAPRELQIVQCVFDDEKVEGIAERLDLSPSTVNTYMQRLYTKLEVNSRAQLILRVMEAHFLLRAAPYAPMTDKYTT